MAARRGAPPLPNREAAAEKWPPGFTYDITVVPPPPPLQNLRPAPLRDIVFNRRMPATHSRPGVLLGMDSSPMRRDVSLPLSTTLRNGWG